MEDKNSQSCPPQSVQPEDNLAKNEKTPPSRGMCVASMVLGILSIVFCVVPFLSVPFGIVGLILGVISRHKDNSSAIAIAGIVTSIVGVALCVVIFMLIFTLAIPFRNGIFDTEFLKYIDKYYGLDIPQQFFDSAIN